MTSNCGLARIFTAALQKLCIVLLVGGAIVAYSSVFHWYRTPPGQGWQAEPTLPNVSFYQHSLLQLLQTRPIANASSYLPYLQYYAATVDTAALRSYMSRHGMHLPSPDSYRDLGTTCHSVATSLSEPFHPDMLIRNRTVRMQLPGGAPLALWRWDSGRITRKEWESVPSDLRGPNGGACAQCGPVLKFKVLNGRLYEWKHNQNIWLKAGTIEMLQVVVHLYNIPDVDLLLHLYDGACGGVPVLGVNVNLSYPNAGFTIPYVDHWASHGQALSLQQAVVWADCMRARYPRNTSIPRAVWRGSTSDPKFALITADNLLLSARYKLHQLSSLYWDMLDARLTRVIQTVDTVPEYCHQHPEVRLCNQTRQHITAQLGLPNPDGTGNPYVLNQEQYQRYSVLLDVDGNSWSSRVFQLLQHTQAPILKQASPLQAWYEHLFAPGGPLAVEHFAPAVHDVVSRAKEVLDSLGCDPKTYATRVGPISDLSSNNQITCIDKPPHQQPTPPARRLKPQKQKTKAAGTNSVLRKDRQHGWRHAIQATNDVAAVLLNRWSIVESVAFSLTKYASLCDWKPQMEPGYNLITSFTGQYTHWLPSELKQAIQQASAAPA